MCYGISNNLIYRILGPVKYMRLMRLMEKRLKPQYVEQKADAKEYCELFSQN